MPWSLQAAARARHPGAHRPDHPGDPARPLLEPGAEPHLPHPRPRAERRAAGHPHARRARPQAGRRPTSPSAAPSSSRTSSVPADDARATSCAAPIPAEPPQIIAFERYAIDLDRFEQKGERGRTEAARALSSASSRSRSERSRLQARSPACSAPSCTSASPARSIRSPSCCWRWPSSARPRAPGRTGFRAIVMAFLLAIGRRLGGLAGNNLVVLHARCGAAALCAAARAPCLSGSC